MSDDPRCWCGGQVGPRVPGDADGLGCWENVHHDWRSPAVSTECSGDALRGGERADALRRAAALMREKANAATPGPWRPDGSEVYSGDQYAWVAETLKADPLETEADSAHIASWHPLVALAVADWLETTALRVESPHQHHLEWLAVMDMAETVARAYLNASRGDGQ